jgi:hypothetical protein
MQNRTFFPYLAAAHGILITALRVLALGGGDEPHEEPRARVLRLAELRAHVHARALHRAPGGRARHRHAHIEAGRRRLRVGRRGRLAGTMADRQTRRGVARGAWFRVQGLGLGFSLAELEARALALATPNTCGVKPLVVSKKAA